MPGLRLVCVLAVAAVAGSFGVVLAHDKTCTGFAPQSTACTTGTHTGRTITHGVTPGIGYAGTLESVLRHSGGARTFRCSVAGGVALECVGSGPFPKAGESYIHSCSSAVADSPGGVGGWSCFVTDS